MGEKLPKIFANQINNVDNNKKYYYSEKNNNINYTRNSKKNNSHKLDKIVHSADINNKIINLFKSPNNVYKVKADIKINGEIVTKNLIGRTNTTLITLDNETININDIEDINKSG